MWPWHRLGHNFVLTVMTSVLLLGARPVVGRPQRTELIYRVLSAAHCKDVQGSAVSKSNTTLRMVGRTKVAFDLDFVLERPAPSLSKLTVNQTRCREIVSASTCSAGESFAVKSGVCGVLNMPLMPWTELVSSMRPPFKCPLAKGAYSGRGVSIDMQVAKMTIRPGEDVGTVVVGRGTVYDQNQVPYMCYEVTADLVRVKAMN